MAIDMEERLQVIENNLGETRADLMMYGDGLKTVQNTVLSHEASIMNCVPPNERMQVAVFESAVSDVAAAGDSGNFACAQWPSLAVPYVAPSHDSVTVIQTAPSSVNGAWSQSDGVDRVKSAPTHGVASAATSDWQPVSPRRQRNVPQSKPQRTRRGQVHVSAENAPIRGAPPPKQDFFLSRLSYDTDIEQLKRYIGGKGMHRGELSLVSHDSVYNSYKLTVGVQQSAN